MNFREKLFVLLYLMKNNSNYTSLGSTFNISKSCVEESIETGIGDSSYVGKFQCNGPAEFLQKYSDVEINANESPVGAGCNRQSVSSTQSGC